MAGGTSAGWLLVSSAAAMMAPRLSTPISAGLGSKIPASLALLLWADLTQAAPESTLAALHFDEVSFLGDGFAALTFPVTLEEVLPVGHKLFAPIRPA